MDYGSWSGKRLSVLSKDRKWKIVQQKPSTFTFPQGESFHQMRKRVDNLLIKMSKEKGPILLVTHGDIIKMMLASSLGMPIDRFQSFVAEPASLTVINLEKAAATILQSNYKIEGGAIKSFAGNQLGGGNSLTNLAKWWRS
jgi:probable phosphoglycerate mutase